MNARLLLLVYAFLRPGTYRDSWRSMLETLRTWRTPPAYEKDDKYCAACKEIGDFRVDEELVGYEDALDHAQKSFDREAATTDILDGKALEVIRAAGIVATLLSFGLNAFKTESPIWFLPSLAFLILAIAVAFISRTPVDMAAPTSSFGFLLDVRDGGRGQKLRNKAYLAASFYCATVGRKVTNDWKAEKVRKATTLLFAGFLFLLVPFLVTLWKTDWSATSSGPAASAGSPPSVPQ